MRTTALSLIVCAGCALHASDEWLRQTGGSAALFGQFKAFDGRTAQPMSFEQLVSRAAAADVILFGEEHSDVVCNALEAQLLAALSRQARPITLAMEFFENDTQSPLDAYLAGRLGEAEFRKLTRQKKAYLTAHRPLIELCRQASIPVVAANAPWRLVRALRLSGQSYEDFRATTQPADRALMPVHSELLTGPYYERFVDATRDHVMTGPSASQPSSQPSDVTDALTSQPTSQPDLAQKLLPGYRAQSLWDDSMAEAVADHRAHYPDRSVMLIVGRFHVAHDGGTQVKLRRRRPNDNVLTIVYHGDSQTPPVFHEADRLAGEIVICGVAPPEDAPPSKPPTTDGPTSAPAIATPTISVPASAPTTQANAAEPAAPDKSPPTATDEPRAAGRGKKQLISPRPESMTLSELREELLRRMERDQGVRTAAKPNVGRLRSVDRENTAWMKQVVERHGWPGKSLVGEDGAFAAWLLVQHADADPKFQARCLELMKSAYEKNEVRGEDLAYLTDRVLVNQGKKQVYGTQFMTLFGISLPRPIEDEANVDSRRAEMGLMPLAEYKKIMQDQDRSPGP